MGFRYRNIRRAAYQAAPDQEPIVAEHRALDFPEVFTARVLEVCNLGREARPLRTAPTRRLAGLLQALASDVVVMQSRRNPEFPHQWLYCPADRPHPLPDKVLRRLLVVWAEDLRKEDEYREAVRELADELSAAPPQWTGVSVPLLRTPVGPGGTAAPNVLQFRLAPDHFARRIQQLAPYPTSAGELRFRAVAGGDARQGAELVSQPLQCGSGKQPWWFSVRIRLTMHTVPFDPLPKLHLHVGVRRWATHPALETGRVRLAFGTSTSVHLRPTASWLPGSPASERYGIARIAWDRKAREHRWFAGDSARMLRRLAMTREFPDVDELLSQPDRWLHGQDDVQALIVHGTRAGTHGVAPGLMPHQRSQIVEWAEQALVPELVRVPDLGRSQLSPDKPAIRPPQGSRVARDAGEQRVARIRRAAIARNCPQQEAAGKPVFGSRLLWQSEKVRDIAIKGLVSALGLEADGGRSSSEAAPGVPGPVVLTWITDELIVRLRCLRLGHGLGDPLDMPPNPKDKRAEHTAAIEGRQRAMAKFLASDGAEATVPQLAVVELARGRAFGAPQNDPKFALRLGSANAGVPTQFLADWVPAKARHRTDSDEGRGRAAWLDGFRQLGASSFPTPQISGGIPTDTQYLAVWMVSTGRSPAKQPARKFPVAVLVRPETAGHATVFGWDSEAFGGVGAWTSYSRLLTRLPSLTRIKPAALAADAADCDQFSSAEWSKFDQRQREAERFIQKVLHSREIRCRPTALLVDSQNSRGLWTWVQDGAAREDLIRTGQAPTAGMNPWLRLVRIRTADMDETPQWWGIDNPSGVNGLAAGFWHQSTSAERTSAEERIFYSTTPKPASFKSSAVEADKLAPRMITTVGGKLTWRIDTSKQGWNPNLVEIAVLGCHQDQGDDPESIAMAVHQMRQAPDHINALRHPLPLHLASQLQEYVLPLGSDEWEEEDADSDRPMVDIDQVGFDVDLPAQQPG